MLDHAVSAGRKLTVAQLWALFPDETHVRHELIDGVHFVTPTPITRHQVLVGRLAFEIELYLRAHPGVGQLFGVPLDCVLSDHDVVEPDIILIADHQMEILTDKNVQGPPALVVEVLSPSTRRRDIGIKRQLFDRAGVREYWILDGTRDRIDLHRRVADGALKLAGQIAAEDGGVLTTPMLPGFAFPLDRLFAR